MKRIVTWCLSTLTVLVLLFGYHTSTSGPGGVGSVVATPALPRESTSDDGSSGTPDSDQTTKTASATVTGPSVDTRWGPVQVEITVSAGEITDVAIPVYPDENPRDQEINSYALPILVDETLKAQSADIDMISGATVTSVGYQQSLQAAIDQADL